MDAATVCSATVISIRSPHKVMFTAVRQAVAEEKRFDIRADAKRYFGLSAVA
jgi:hypothetical protein